MIGEKPLSITEIFERDCPYYLAIGMTYDQYWYDDPLMVRAFYKAEQVRQEMRDTDAWNHGAYVKAALDSVIGNMFRPKGREPIKYPDKPSVRAAREQQEQTRRDRKIAEEQELAFARAYMVQFCAAGKNWGK